MSFDRIEEQLKETVTLKQISVSVDSYGHTSESANEYNLECIPMILSNEDMIEKESELSIGDMILYVNVNTTNADKLSLGNQVVYNGSTYKIIKIIKEKNPNRDAGFYYYEVLCQKID